MSFLAGIELATNQDGRLELVAIAHEDAADIVWHRWERLEGGWSEWHSFGKPGGPLSGQPVTHRPTVARNMKGCLEVVVVGVDQGVYRAWQDHPGRAWRGWHALNKPGESEAVSASPVLGQNNDGRLELFLVDGHGEVWHRWQDKMGRWMRWHSLGPPGERAQASTPAVVRNKDGRLELFVTVQSLSAVSHCWQRREGGWSGWELLEGLADHAPIATAPVVAGNKDGRLELFVSSVRGELWHSWQLRKGGWSAWESLGRPNGGVGEVGVGAHADGRLALFAIVVPPDFDREVWWREQAVTGGWSDWRSLGVPAKEHRLPGRPRFGKPTLALNADGRLELFSQDMDTAGLYWLRQTSPSGSEWKSAWMHAQPPSPHTLTGSEPSP